MMINMDERTLACKFIQEVQHLETATADRLIVDKVSAPNRVGLFGLCRLPGADTPSQTPWLAWGDQLAPVHVADLARAVYPPASLRPSTAS